MNEVVPFNNDVSLRIRSSLDLPYNLNEQIGLNEKNIIRLLQLGGIGNIHISEFKNHSQRETGKGNSLYRSTFPHSEEGEDPFAKHSNWTSVNLQLNVSEIEKKVRESRLDYKNPDVWVAELQQHLLKAIVSIGIKNLLRLPTPLIQLFSVGLYTDDLLHLTRCYTEGLPYLTADTGGNLFILPLCHLLISSLAYGKEKKGQGRRVSLFIGPEIDRATILLLYANCFKPTVASTIQR